jgi:Ca2+-binding RTX toxin-like protein
MAVIIGIQSNHLYNGSVGGDVMSVLPGVHNSTLAGGNGNDTIDGSFGEGIVLDGGAGSDLLSGRDGEHFIGGTGLDSLVLDLTAIDSGVTANLSRLGAGATVAVSEATVTGVEVAVIALGDGADHVTSSARAAVGIYAGGGDDVLVGRGSVDVLAGGAGSDLVKGAGGSDVLYGHAPDQIFGFDVPGVGADDGSGHDTLMGGDGADLLYGSLGDDRIDGGEGIDTVSYADAPGAVDIDLRHLRQHTGAAGVDTLVSVENVIGGSGGDHLRGDDGVNLLSGGGGDDTIEGGDGSDVMSGGSGTDVFVFSAAHDSGDAIIDLGAGDHIDLSRIDADTDRTGNQAFHIVNHFDGHAGQLMVVHDGVTDTTVVLGDVDGDFIPDFGMVLNGDQTGFAGWAL